MSLDKRKTAAVFASATLAAIAGGVALSGAAGAPADARSGSPRARLASASTPDVAHIAGAEFGDANSTNATEVDTTRRAALRVLSPGDKVGDTNLDVPVRVIQMAGNFIHTTPFMGRPPLTGHWLTVTIDASTGRELDFAMGDERPPIEQLGPPRVVATGP